MLKLRPYLFILLILATLVLLNPKSYALNEKQFSVDYDISYHILDDGVTEVVQKVTLTNLKNDVVPTSYSFSTMNTKILEISAESNGKKVTAELNIEEEESGFTVPIINQSIGKDKQNEIIVTYKTDSLLVKTGQVWNIYIPKIQVPSTTNIYNVKVYVPKNLGPKMYFSPTPATEKVEGDNTVYYLTKNTFKGAGISGAFGDSQKINFNIKYQLENKTILPLIYKIPLPSDIENYQQVAYLDLSPKPLKIEKVFSINLLQIIKGNRKYAVENQGNVFLYSDSGMVFPPFEKEYIYLSKDLHELILETSSKERVKVNY